MLNLSKKKKKQQKFFFFFFFFFSVFNWVCGERKEKQQEGTRHEEMWKKSNEIKGVSAASFVDLQATLLSAKETARSSGSSQTAQPIRSAIHFKTVSASSSSSSSKDVDNKHNSGVDQRNQRDAEAMEREKKNLQSGQKRLEEKSALYEKLMSSASRSSSSLDSDFLDEDRRAPLVDFERKSWESDSQVISSMKRKRQIESLSFLNGNRDDDEGDREDNDDDEDGGGVGVSRRGSSEPLAKRHRARASTNPFTFLPQEESETDRDQRVELAKKASLVTEKERQKLQDLQRQKNLSKLRRLQQIREQSTSSSTLSKSILQTLSAAASSPPSSPETTQDERHNQSSLDFLDRGRPTPSSSQTRSQRKERDDYEDGDADQEVDGATFNAEIKRGIAPPANLYQTITPSQPNKEAPRPSSDAMPKPPQTESEAKTLADQNAEMYRQYELQQQQQYAQYYQQQQQYHQYYYGQQTPSDPQQTGAAPSYDQYYQQYSAQQPADPYYQHHQYDYSQYYQHQQQQQYYPSQEDSTNKPDSA
jgi:hypothetical protein